MRITPPPAGWTGPGPVEDRIRGVVAVWVFSAVRAKNASGSSESPSLGSKTVLSSAIAWVLEGGVGAKCNRRPVMEGGRGANPAADLVEACDEHRQIADFALALPSRESFRGQLFSYLDGAIGFDLATAAHTPDGARFEVHARGELDVAAMRERLWQYLGELDPRESEAPFCDRPVVDSAFLSMARKSQLSIYREVWRPAGLSVLMLALWRNRFGGFGLVLGRSGRGVCFRESEVELLARCLPQIRLSEALMSGAEDSVFDRWSQRVGLSRREREIAALVARGLRNREIAEVLEVSPLTVRNQLAAVFRKAEVTTRAELVGAMHWREAGGLAIPYCAGGARKGG